MIVKLFLSSYLILSIWNLHASNSPKQLTAQAPASSQKNRYSLKNCIQELKEVQAKVITNKKSQKSAIETLINDLGQMELIKYTSTVSDTETQELCSKMITKQLSCVDELETMLNQTKYMQKVLKTDLREATTKMDAISKIAGFYQTNSARKKLAAAQQVDKHTNT
jgi:hypothetical protein